MRQHALIITFFLFFLISILGARAYTVARNQMQETAELANYDLEAQTLLFQLESSTTNRDQARRKFKITHDKKYSELLIRYEESMISTTRALEQVLSGVYPELSHQALSLASAQEIMGMRHVLDFKREQKLRHSHEAARGLMQLIGIALALSVAITAWVIFLFQFGLIRPLRKIKEATRRMREGDLAFRIMPSGFPKLSKWPKMGVAEVTELESSFNAMAEQLQILERSKNEFLATISHEIKNPLAALKEGLSLLARQGESLSVAARGRGFSACLISSKRLESMISNLLNISKMENGLFDFSFSRKNLSGVIEQAIDEVRPLAEKKGMRIRYEGDPKLEASFNWDGMIQVLENLLLNAIKYGQEKSEIDVKVSPAQRNMIQGHESSGERVPHIEVSVINSGVPLSNTDASRIFERFYRAETARQHQGLGIGLYVVKRIIEAHHGSVQASAHDGKTHLQFWIPSQYESAGAAG